MAIKRCPYCRALIDEKEQYCNNCGTQLLFPDDGAIEEEIPGDKIIDADVEEKDYEIPEPGAEKPVDDSEGEDDDEDEVRTSEDDGKPAEEDEDEEEDEEPEEVVLVEEAERDSPEPAPVPAEALEIPVMLAAPKGEAPDGGKSAEPESDEVEAAGSAREPEEARPEPEPEEFAAPAKKPLTFDTSDLDKIGRTAELGKEQVENFLEVLKEREQKNRLDRAAAREPEEALPPWAAGIKDGGVEPSPPVKVEMMREDDIETQEPEEPETREDTEAPTGLEEREPPRAHRPRVADSGIGLPEKVAQAALPFERQIPREEGAARPAVPPAAGRRPIVRDEEAVEEPEEEAAEREARPRPPFRLSVFLKAKSFDILFVAVFWLASLWIAARSMDVTLFQMLGKASSGLLAYFGALLVLYFFLFYFFLGETLGDRLFRDAD
jgi:hypothetical protein